MKVVDSGILPNGVEIQLESWGNEPTLMIAAYPIAQRMYGHWVQGGAKFRLQISSNPYSGYTTDMVRADYKALLSGEKCCANFQNDFGTAKGTNGALVWKQNLDREMN